MSAAMPDLEENNVERKWTMRLRAEWVIIGTIVSTLSAFAQETIVVTGRVFDQETQKPVVSANVILRGEKKGTITDSTGSFRLELAAQQKHILAFSHVAYRKETRELAPGASKEIEFRIYLVPEPIYMQEVVVYGNREAVLTKAAEKRAIHSIGGEEFEKLGEEDMERALIYFLPDVVNRLDKRMASNADDFTLYVNGDWKESLTLSDIDPFTIRRVLVWEQLGRKTDIDSQGKTAGYGRGIDVFPPGMPLRRGKFVVLVETK
jgi:hypothetical protein